MLLAEGNRVAVDELYLSKYADTGHGYCGIRETSMEAEVRMGCFLNTSKIGE
jgi:hypothetical protein